MHLAKGKKNNQGFCGLNVYKSNKICQSYSLIQQTFSENKNNIKGIIF